MKQNSFNNNLPSLFLVSTPIGNLEDITFRAINTLKSVDYILVEDSRKSSTLLNHYQIKKPLIQYHDHNKDEKNSYVLSLLKDNKNIALISDAGTPCIADPGFELSRMVANEGYNVVSIPGASALLTALVCSGLITHPFIFVGFLPRKNQQIVQLFQKYIEMEVSIIFYESPNRIKNSIEQLKSFDKNFNICIARELTKKFETIIRGKIEKIDLEMLDHRGEYVVVIEAYSHTPEKQIFDVVDEVNKLIKDGLTKNEAIKQIAKNKKVNKNELYQTYISSTKV